MTVDRTLLVRYLRQRSELGGPELFLDTLTAEEALAAVAPKGKRGGIRPARSGGGGDVPERRGGVRPTRGAGGGDLLEGGGADPTRSGGGGDLLEGGRPGERRRWEEGQTGAGGRHPADRTEGDPAAGAPPAVRRPAAQAPPDSRRPAAGAPPDQGRQAVRPRRPADSGAAAELQVLAEQASTCTRCRLHEARRTVVFGEGNPAAEVVVVGEGPGAEEDRTGRPFVGPAGKLLDLLLLSAGLAREDVYICNVLKCRPPNNRDPRPDEIETCSSYLHAQLERIAPRVLLAAGKFAAQTLTGSTASIGKLRGRVHAYRGIPLVATYHPAFLLRSPQWTRASWQDLQLVREVLDEQA